MFGGKAEVTFRGYALNEEEVAKLYQELDKSDLDEVLKLAEGATEESLEQLKDEIEEFLNEEDEESPKEQSRDKSNPFLALIGHYDKPEKSKNKKENKKNNKVEEEIIVKKDTWIEKTHFRPLVKEKAEEQAFNIFDIYKKAHGMAAYT